MSLWAAAGLSLTSNEEWQVLLRGECCQLLVAEEDGVLLGAGIMSFDGWRAFVYHVAVAANERGRGIATSLVAEAERQLASKGAGRIFALVHESMTDGLALCATNGYEPEGDLVFVKDLVDRSATTSQKVPA